jgi:hypothetical protein
MAAAAKVNGNQTRAAENRPALPTWTEIVLRLISIALSWPGSEAMLTTARHANLAESFASSAESVGGFWFRESRHVARFGSNSVLLFIGEDCGSTSLSATNHVHNESPRLIAMLLLPPRFNGTWGPTQRMTECCKHCVKSLALAFQSAKDE